jgi:hypothetical protein
LIFIPPAEWAKRALPWRNGFRSISIPPGEWVNGRTVQNFDELILKAKRVVALEKGDAERLYF